MKILQLTPRLPFPPVDGGRVVMLQIARAMQRHGASVRVLSLNPRKQRASVEDARQALAPIPIDVIDIDTSRYVAAALRGVARGVPFLVSRFYSPRFARVLRSLLAEHPFDVVQIESPFLLPYLPLIREASRAVVVLRSLNVEFLIWEQLAAQADGMLRKMSFRSLTRSLRAYETKTLNACDALVPITEDDARTFRALGCTRPMHVLPGGIETSRAQDGESIGEEAIHRGGSTIGFLGSLDYRPNQDAAIWIATGLRSRVDATIRIAGSHAPSWLRQQLSVPGVIFEGEVPDAAAFLRSLDVVLVPIFSGGGMRIKILEAMAQGRAVVATRAGAEGIDVVDGRDVLIAETRDDFIAAVNHLLHDRVLARSVGDAGRRLVQSHYSVDALAGGLLAFYEQLTERRRIETRR